MAGFQIALGTGTLDGATALVIPDPLPLATENVIKLPQGAGVNVGRVNLAALLGDFASSIWLKTIQCEFAALTRAARFSLFNPASNVDELLLPVLATGGVAPLMSPRTLSDRVVLPVGAELLVLTDDTDDTFTGAPVAGPHFLYVEVEAIANDEEARLIRKIEQGALDRSKSEGISVEDFQDTAATLTTRLGVVPTRAPGGTGQTYQIQSARVTVGIAPAAGEDMVINVVRRHANSNTATTLGSITIDSAAFTLFNQVADIPLISTNLLLNAGDTLEVQRIYTPGMAPTPIVNTTVQLAIAPVALGALVIA